MPVTRRSFHRSLGAASLAALAPFARGQFSPIRRYSDPSTEAEILCLSDPSRASFLPFHYNRACSSRQNFLLYSMEGPTGLQAYRIELKGGALRPLTAAGALHARAFALSSDDKTLYFADGDRLYATSAASLSKPRELYRASSESVWKCGFSVQEDGSALTFVDGGKLISIPLRSAAKAASRVLAEVDAACSEPLVAKSNAVLLRDGERALHLVNPGGKAERLALAGKLGPAIWNPDGRSFLFLRTDQGRGIANSLHEYSLDTRQESLVGKTSQFVHFNRNADSSVFVGASGSKAQPYVLLMLRITRRELALCEHKASDATQVSPVFSPSSKRVFFQSDRLGKSAIFSVAVERLVEPTEDDEETKKS